MTEAHEVVVATSNKFEQSDNHDAENSDQRSPHACHGNVADREMTAGAVVQQQHQNLPPPSSHLSLIESKQVDDAFESMFGYKWGSLFTFSDSHNLTHQENLLVSVLGWKAAASIAHTPNNTNLDSTFNRAHKDLTQQSYKSVVVHKRPHIVKSSLLSLPGKIVSQPSSTKMLQEQSNVPKATVAAEKALSNTKNILTTNLVTTSGVDKLLKNLAAPEKVTVVAKTSLDWDQFKQESGQGEKLEEKAESKDAFLNRQDFLNRVDHRKFAIEREERDRERSKRGK